MESDSPKRQRSERVLFETDRHLVVGDMTLPADGYQNRFSDALNRADIDFIPLLNAEVTPIGGGGSAARDFMVIAKRHIRMAHPFE
jgi:hypothetical protein